MATSHAAPDASTSSVTVVLCTVPSEQVGVDIAKQLLEEQLVACVNIVPGLRSIYRYQGKLEDDRELLLIMKTALARVEALISRVRELHPYQVCEVLALEVTAGNPAYLAWVLDETRGPALGDADVRGR